MCKCTEAGVGFRFFFFFWHRRDEETSVVTSFEIRFTHACFRSPSRASRGQSCGELRGNPRPSSGARAPADNVLEIEMSSSDMDGDEFAAVISSAAPPAWRRGARGEEAARPPVCSNFHLLLDLNFPGELRDKRSLIKERKGGRGGSVSSQLNFQEWYPWQPGKQDIIKRVKRS